MKTLFRLATAATVAAVLCPATLSAQNGRNPFHWYVGGSGGVTIFETPRQNRAAIPTFGGNILITARRTALLLSVEEGVGSDE